MSTKPTIFQIDEHTVEVVRTEPKKCPLGPGNAERSRYKVLIDGSHRAFIIFPNGWAKTWELITIEITHIRIARSSGGLSSGRREEVWHDLARKAVEALKDGKLRSAEELAVHRQALRDDAEARALKHRESQAAWVAEGIALVQGLRDMRERLANVAQAEDLALLEKAAAKLFAAYPSEVREHFEPKAAEGDAFMTWWASFNTALKASGLDDAGMSVAREYYERYPRDPEAAAAAFANAIPA
jgi:hypothetical protein